MFIGIDLGTSSIKSILIGEDGRLIATASEPLKVSRPAPGFSEQDPESWYQATLSALDNLAKQAPREMATVRGIGLSGQQHGATLLDKSGNVLRPCILWNDVRSAKECKELEERLPALGSITGNPTLPGFTAPKLVWVKRHEPAIFARVAKVLLPKAYLRYRLSGEYIEDMSDASGTAWLEVGKRAWSKAALEATDLSIDHMPALVEGTAPAGRLRAELAQRWGMVQPPVIAGSAGDNAAGAIALGAIHPGDAFVSLGTSGVLWATTAGFAPNTTAAVHAFCHCVPNTWHQMGVILSAASCLSWLSSVVGVAEGDLLKELGEAVERPSSVVFLPYLSGERTPHNDADIRGAFAGMSHDTSRAVLAQSVMEGVAFAMRDCLEALRDAGTRLKSVDAIGGGARSKLWLAIIANVLDLPVNRLADSEVSGAMGGALLGRMAATGEPPSAVCKPPRRMETLEPQSTLRDAYAGAYAHYRKLYPAIKEATR
ncbi:xylulokinase [Dongia deserti]|uniref:xylulokinase n=1 Tax=Dongia deserti TaxID=2268030 RepID=UPI000E64F9B1|nr:xylulokinase [Dongia deserti]